MQSYRHDSYRLRQVLQDRLTRLTQQQQDVISTLAKLQDQMREVRALMQSCGEQPF